MQRRTPLRLVPPPRPPADGAVPAESAPGDVGLLVFLLAVNVLPVAALLAGGRWGAGTAGLGTATALLCGRELARELRAHLARSRR